MTETTHRPRRDGVAAGRRSALLVLGGVLGITVVVFGLALVASRVPIREAPRAPIAGYVRLNSRDRTRRPLAERLSRKNRLQQEETGWIFLRK